MDAAARVKEANREIYDRLGAAYETLDGRRTEALGRWIRRNLAEVAALAGGHEVLLDIGCGGGFVARQAAGIFTKVCGLDISAGILKTLSCQGIYTVCAEAEGIPLRDSSVDVAVFFAAIHHLYDYRPVLREAYRVLRGGGVIYIDHDMNASFYKRFGPLIAIYRRLSRKEKRLARMSLGELFRRAEFHASGIEPEQLMRNLEAFGFRVARSVR